MTSAKVKWSPAIYVPVFLLLFFFASAPFLRHLPLSTLPIYHKATSFHAPKQNIWAELSRTEANGVLSFLFSRPDLNLTDASKATSRDNHVTSLELLQPNKTDVLPYLDGLSGPPKRWARVTVTQGATETPYIVTYMVGPLPASESMQMIPLDFCHNSGRNHVVNPHPPFDQILIWGVEFGASISDVTKDLLGGVVDPLDPNSLRIGGGNRHIINGTLTQWMQFYRKGVKTGASSLLPQGLYSKVVFSSRDPKNWKMHQWYYNGIMYDSVSDLRDAMKSPNFEKIPINDDGAWTDTDDFTENLDRDLPPPMMIQPEGNRYKIDTEQNFISWMGFEFFHATTVDTGVSLHDIRFGGDSVIHELGLQEALAHYAGDDPEQGTLEFLDASFSMGVRMFELVPGYDCPAYATFLDATFHKEGSHTNKNSICIFEYTADHPIQRHTSDFQVSVSRNTYLIVRWVSTVGNYDYTFDYIFYLDGTVEVKVRASGYIFAAFWQSKSQDEYGYRVHDALATSMHDHVLNFKADLDVAGTENTLLQVVVEPLTTEYVWDDMETTPRNTMHLVPRTVEKETSINWPKNSAEMLIVINQNTTNSWNEKRGYRIAPGTGMGTPSHLTILNSTSLNKAAEWATQDLWVVKQKDTEPRSASSLNWLDPKDPLVDFSKFIDGEDVVQEDLVVYFNLGTHHVPHSGDIPNTLMHTSASSVMFTPFNFHDRDPSRLTAQGVKLELGAEKTKARYYGGRNTENVKIKAADLEPDLSVYQHVARPWTKMSSPLPVDLAAGSQLDQLNCECCD